MKFESIRNVLLCGLAALVTLSCAAGSGVDAATAVHLRSEYLVDPVGIDETRPRLSWEMVSARRGEVQTAYHVRVASSRELLERGEADLWESGVVQGNQSAHVEYAGLPLESRQRCYWAVQVYNRDGAPSAWSKPAWWEMGLLEPADWQAQWINATGYPYASVAEQPAPVDLKILSASYGAGESQADVTENVAGRVAAGGLAVRANNATFGDPAQGEVKTLTVQYELNGEPGEISVAEDQWVHIPASYRPPAGGKEPVAYLRRHLELEAQPVARARLYVTALGLHQVYLNGEQVSDIFFAPEWTDYNRRVQYNVYDVTAQLRPGANVLAAQVGDGWYSGHVGMGGFQHYGTTPALLAQLEITYADGTTATVTTDTSWKATAGPIQSSDFMRGERYDARLEIPGWNAVGLDDGAWAQASVRQERDRKLEGVVMDPIRVVKELPALRVEEPTPETWIFDLGQNMVGVVRLSVSAPAGAEIGLRYGEMLNPDGTLYTANLRAAHPGDTYIAKGDGLEIYVPSFTFHGFRYVELTGLPAAPEPGAITGLPVASDLRQTGHIRTSDERVNQLYANIVWGQRGNFLTVPTDCPQRDERLGWGGDALVFVRTATYNADVAAFFTKWALDMRDAQTPDGAFTDVSPRVGFSAGTPGWGDAGVVCPWTIYQMYGDTRILEENYEAIVKWVEWSHRNSSGLIRDRNRGFDYGDWLSINANTPKDLLGTAYFARSTRMLARIAEVLGKTEDAAKYEQLFQAIKAAFNDRYVQPDGRIHGHTQTCYLMALRFELLSEEMQGKALEHLVADIRARNMHLSTGFHGVSYLLPTLTAAGETEVAYQLFLQDEFPSWLFSVKHGATTIWERWDGWTPERGFQDPGMNSFNHFSLGSCGEWMFASLAGIDTDGPGFRRLTIRPTLGEGIDWVEAHFDSINGRIESAWRVADGAFGLDLVVPANATATVYVPAAEAARVMESGLTAEQAEGVTFLRMEDGAAVYAVGSGRYRFESAL